MSISFSNFWTYRKFSIGPPGCIFLTSTFDNREKLIKERVEGGLFDLAKRITGSKNTVVRDRVDRLRVVQVTVNSI